MCASTDTPAGILLLQFLEEHGPPSSSHQGLSQQGGLPVAQLGVVELLEELEGLCLAQTGQGNSSSGSSGPLAADEVVEGVESVEEQGLTAKASYSGKNLSCYCPS